MICAIAPDDSGEADSLYIKGYNTCFSPKQLLDIENSAGTMEKNMKACFFINFNLTLGS